MAKKKSVRKPRSISFGGTKFGEFGRSAWGGTEYAKVCGSLLPKGDVRRFASWLLKAAEYLDAKKAKP